MASKIMNVIIVIFTLAILILLILITNSVLLLSDIDVTKILFINFTILTSNFQAPPFAISI